MFNKEKTYTFSWEGFAECKADNMVNFIEKHHTFIDLIATGIGLIALYSIISPLGATVAYKTLTAEQTAEVAFKLIQIGL